MLTRSAAGRMTTIEPAGPGTRITLPAILVLAAALRLVGLTSFPLWEDELYTLSDSARLITHPAGLAADPRPLYFLIQYFASFVLPETPVGLRLLPFVFGVAGVWVTWRIGARLVGITAGLVAASLVAIAPWHIYVSQIGRYLSLLYLLAGLFFLAVHQAYHTDRPRAYGGALLWLLAGVLTHPIFLFPAVGVALACTLVAADGRFGWRWPSRSAWLYLWGPCLVVLALLYGILGATGTLARVTSGNARMLGDTLRLLPGVVQALTPTVAMAGLLGGVFLALQPRPGPRRWGLMTLLGGGTTCLILLLATRSMAFTTVHAMPMYPLLFVSAGALVQLGADHFMAAKPAGRAAFILAAVLLLVTGVLPSTLSHLSDGTRFDYRPAFAQIRARDPSLPVVTWPVVQQRHYAPDLKGVPLPENGSTAVLDSMQAGGGAFWVVASFRRYGLAFDHAGARTRWLLDHCRLASRHVRPRLDYEEFRVELYRCGPPP